MISTDNPPMPASSYFAAVLAYGPLSEAMMTLLSESSRITNDLAVAVNDPDGHSEDDLAALVRKLQAAHGRARGAYQQHGARRVCTECLAVFVPAFARQETCSLDCAEAQDEAARDGSALMNGIAKHGGAEQCCAFREGLEKSSGSAKTSRS